MRSYLITISFGLLFTCAHPVRADFINQVLLDNPTGFWILNDVPGLPATALDSSVNGFNGTYGLGVSPQGIAGPAWVPSSGLVADFNGGSISFASPLNLGANGFTIEAWINPSIPSLLNTTRIVASGDGFNGYGFGTSEDGGLVFTSFTVQDYNTTTLALTPNVWQYVGIVLDEFNDANFYLNGVLVETVDGIAGGTDAPSTDFTIGNQSPGFGHTDEIYLGGLAGVSVYDRALTSEEIQDQYISGIVPEPSSLVLVSLGALVAGRNLRQRRRKA